MWILNIINKLNKYFQNFELSYLKMSIDSHKDIETRLQNLSNHEISININGS